MMIVRFKEWESRSALQSHIDGSGHRALVVGKAAESPRRFYSCVVESVRGSVEVGVISSDHGVAPAAVALDEARVLVVGRDTCLTWVNLDRAEYDRARPLGGVFYEFIPVSDDEVVVLHELGVLRVDSRGGEAWRVDTDVIEDCVVDAAGNLVLTVMDASAPIAVGIESGKAPR
jgi:hypothetical protein